MLVRDFMTGDVVTLAPDLTCSDAQLLFRRQRIRRAPVVLDGRVLGMISERDLLAVLPGTIGAAETPAGAEDERTPIRRVMSTPVVSVRSTDHLETAARLMLQHRIGGLPVVDRDALKGMITESDAFRALWRLLRPAAGCRVAIDEPAGAGDSLPELVTLANEHGCRIHALLRASSDAALHSTFWLEGGDVDALLRRFARPGRRIVSVDRPP